MWVAVVVAVVIFGVLVIFTTWVWRRAAEDPPAPPPAPPVDPVTIENEINSLMPDFESAMQDVRDWGQTNGPHCSSAVSKANRLKELLDQYKDNPTMSQTTYDQLKANFQAAERFLDSWCTDYVLY